MTVEKKLVLLLVVFFTNALYAQVGINTKVPQGVFHVDPKGDTSGITGTGDDLIITSKGYVGIGTLSPANHLHIDKGTASSFLRIEDTTEGTGDKFLASDASGNGSWIPRVTLNGKVYRMTSPEKKVIDYPANTDSPILFNMLKPDVGPIGNNPDNGYIRIDNDGSYVFTFRWWGASMSKAAPGTHMKHLVLPGYVKIRKVIAGVVQVTDIASVIVFPTLVAIPGGSYRFAFTTSMFAPDLKKGELYSVLINPLTDTWSLGVAISADKYDNVIYFPSVMVYNI